MMWGGRGLVLVRFAVGATIEIRLRRIVPSRELLADMWMEEGFEPLYHRAMIELASSRERVFSPFCLRDH